jgi:cardiolipin synthase
VDGEVADSVRITREEHLAHRGVFNRIKWAVAYFLVAIADYRISRMLNFGAERR